MTFADDVAVVIPYSGGDPHREDALNWVADRWNDAGYRVRGGACDGPWSKGRALADAISMTDAPILVCSDADVWTPVALQAIEQVRRGAAAWAQPHSAVLRLSEPQTVRVLAGVDEGLATAGERGDISPAKLGGGLVVLTRDVWETAPMDPRFVGWGQEDEAWGRALSCLLGDPWRGESVLFHLWHPPAHDGRYGSQANKDLFLRYVRAGRRGNPKMRDLIDEAKAALCDS